MDVIRKNGGTVEQFDPSKLERSVRAAGADDLIVQEVVGSVGPTDVRTTRELRHEVSKRLRGRDEEVARRYETSRVVLAHATDEVAKGEVCMNEGVVQQLMLWADDLVELRHAGRSSMARIYRCNPETRELLVNPAQMRALDASEGSRVVVSKVE